MRAVAAILALALTLLPAAPALAQQQPDADADVSVANPAWPVGKGPIVAIDEGHDNFHTVDGRYGPFARLLRNDGFVVTGLKGPFTAESLKDVTVLVIANAQPPGDYDPAAEPQQSAFTPAEIAAVKAWVEDGGALLLIADHMPFAGAATELGKAFGFTFTNGYTQVPRQGQLPDVFNRKNGWLGAHFILQGRSAGEDIDEVATFTGSAFTAPAAATPILTLPAGSRSIGPDEKGDIRPDGPSVDVGGKLQGAVMPVGKGRVAVFGEAAMFSAQVVKQNDFHMGFNNPRAPRNKQFALNLLRWLAGARN